MGRHLSKQLSFTKPSPSTATDLTDESLQHLGISPNQMKEFRDAFNLFDKSGQGRLGKEDLGRVMHGFGQFARQAELEEMLKEIDRENKGYVNFQEFVALLINFGNVEGEADGDKEEVELREAFKVFDRFNRGYIVASDLRFILQCLGEDLSEEEIEEMIREVDYDKDGRIDYYDFVHAMGTSEESSS